MILIADAGGTKSDWRLLSEEESGRNWLADGINPVLHPSAQIRATLEQALSELPRPDQVSHLYYYGAGCWEDVQKEFLTQLFRPFLPNARIEIFHDLVGAARATCLDEPGIACILGTGSNSCLYNGKEIIDNVINLGYMLGDEGSGAHIGKEILRAYFYRELPPELVPAFELFYPHGRPGLLRELYEGSAPSRFLAGFSPFILQHLDHPFIHDLVANCFLEFLDCHVTKYAGASELPVHFIGSVAYHFWPVLQATCLAKGLHPGQIVRRPIDQLAEFHRPRY